MVQLPIRKCYHVTKLGVVVFLAIAAMITVERWHKGKLKGDVNTLEAEYERQILADEARIVPGLGEGGAAANLEGMDKELGEESVKYLAMNVYLSNRIAYNRSIKDERIPACKQVVYDAELPSVSVIIIFHNDPYSTVVRTIWSVINSARRDQPWYQNANIVDRETGRTMSLGYLGQDPKSTFVYLKEIILVDDCSTLPELKDKLSHYIRTRLPPGIITILKQPERRGIAQSRNAGSQQAVGDVLIFLDSHCEASPDWLRPILQTIKDNKTTVVTPDIVTIDKRNFQYQSTGSTLQIGGFDFNGHFDWIDIPEREKKRRGSDIGATWSPTMAGGLFAINREYYWELGGYDEQMTGWGGENLEMSYRIWQCGGTLVTIPCSQVGHVFRAFHPYPMPSSRDTHGVNTARMAAVWMDDYKELFYLECKSFEWYLQHIYKEKYIPVKNSFGYGRFRNKATRLCLDDLQREHDGAPLGVYSCHTIIHYSQFMLLELDGVLRNENKCVQLQYNKNHDKITSGKLLLRNCKQEVPDQAWRYTPTKQLIHIKSGLCLDSGFKSKADVMAVKCKDDAWTQRWEIDYSEYNQFRLKRHREPSANELALDKLRGPRNISLVLMSYNESDNHFSSKKIRRHKHRKKKNVHT